MNVAYVRSAVALLVLCLVGGLASPAHALGEREKKVLGAAAAGALVAGVSGGDPATGALVAGGGYLAYDYATRDRPDYRHGYRSREPYGYAPVRHYRYEERYRERPVYREPSYRSETRRYSYRERTYRSEYPPVYGYGPSYSRQEYSSYGPSYQECRPYSPPRRQSTRVVIIIRPDCRY